MIQFDGRTPSRVVASVAIEFGPKLRNYEQVFVYAVVHTDYENLIEEGTAEMKKKKTRRGSLGGKAQ